MICEGTEKIYTWRVFALCFTGTIPSSSSLNVFIANTKQGVGPQVFPTLVTALPLQYTYKALHRQWRTYLSRDIWFQTIRYVRPAKAQTSLRIRAVWSEPLLVAWLLHDCRATDQISFEVSKLNRRPHRLVWVYASQSATLLEIPHRLLSEDG